MQENQRAQLDAAKFWIEAAHRLGFTDPDRNIVGEWLDDACRCLIQPQARKRSRRDTSPLLVRFLYTFESELAAFIDDYLDQKLDDEGRQVAALLIDAWPGLRDLLKELKVIQQEYRDSPHYHRMVDLIENWDFDVSGDDNIARHHLRIKTPKTRQ